MSMGTPEPLITLAEYRLTGTAASYERAITALAERVEREGLAGVETYRFHANARAGTAAAIIAYEDSETWAKHHELVAGGMSTRACRRPSS